MKRRLFLVPILCSLMLAGCGHGAKESQAAAQSAVVQTARTSTDPAATESEAMNSAVPAGSIPSQSDSNAAPASPETSAAAVAASEGNAGQASGQAAAKAGGDLSGIVPAELAIPAIGVDAKVLSLGLTREGAMDVPRNGDDVGWFKPGYRPGSAGHAVIAGHVDTKTAAAVFYKLKDLKKGSKIIVRSRDGRQKVFKVIESVAYPYDKAPLEKIFGPSDRPLLNLITCTGLYSRSKGTHQQRLVVTAELVS